MASRTHRRIVLATDYRGGFQSKMANLYQFCSLDTPTLVRIFGDLGYAATIVPLNRIPFEDTAIPVLFTSAEDGNGLYKSFVESIAMGLEAGGGTALPRAELIKAHHNKVLMEVLKTTLSLGDPVFRTQYFGTIEDLGTFVDDGVWPKVLKPSYGSGSSGVSLVRSREDLHRRARRIARSFTPRGTASELKARAVRKGYVRRSLHRRAFIVQEFLEDISAEYKVLVFGTKYYVLQRILRPGEFRGSAMSLRLDFNPAFDETLTSVLDFAQHCYGRIDTPCLSLDIVLQHGAPQLLEFQCLTFGPVAAEKSERYYVRMDGGWRAVEQPCELERTFAEAVLDYLDVNPRRGDALVKPPRPTRPR